MSTKDQLLQEIDQAPEFLLNEVLNFYLFLKLRLSQRSSSNQATPLGRNNPGPAFLQKAQEISQQLSYDQPTTLPADFAKNLDHYLYGVPKTEL